MVRGSDELDALRNDMARLRGDFKDLLRSLRGDGGHRLADWRDRIGTVIQDKAVALRERSSELGEKMSDYARDTRKLVEDHPVLSALAGVLVGIVAAAFLIRRR